MISDVHYIELYVNNQLIELESQESLNLRINRVLFNPTKTTTTQSEFSYSFDIPSTPNNDKIFDYANNLAKMNKFRARYKTEVYADGDLIFDGSLTIQKYSAKNKKYTCNLVNIKINTLDEIFGDAVLTDMKWEVPFSGAPTINSVNNDASSKYFFPLVSYGVFQKNYVTKDEVSATYTPKHTIDKYNKWWVESFYPSLNVLETMKKAFEWKGYTVQGSAFSDPNIANIYASCNLAQEQVPLYNLGNPKFGNLTMTVNWSNASSSSGGSDLGNGRNFRTVKGGVPQDLKFPYERVYNVYAGFQGSHGTRVQEYNFSTIDIWNMMDSTNNSNVSVDISQDTYMYDPNEMVIVIPADGWYRISLYMNASLNGAGQSFTASQWTNKNGDELEKRNISLKKDLKNATPLEIQLIRNYNDNVELIKGSRNVEYATGDPNDQTYEYGTKQFPNKSEWWCDYPHQNLYGNKAATETEGLVITTNSVESNENGNFGGSRSSKTTNDALGGTYNNTNGYIHKDGYVMPYDQAVSEAFICGFSSLGSSGGNGTVAVMRNDRSWNKQCTINNKVFANVDGMNLVKKSGNTTTTIATDYCKNDYKNSYCGLFSSSSSMLNGRIQCCVYLNRNDILELVAVQRGYDELKYTTSATCQLEITAISDRSYAALQADNDWNYYSQTEFPTKLNLFNFANKETKVSDWISNVQKAFNLELVMNANDVEINTNKGIRKDITYAIDIDDRVSNDEAESEYISYPKEMSVQYKINTDEWGFELTVPQEHINDEDWFKYGDSGYTVIQLNDDTYETSTQNTSTNFSYTWYDNFLYKEVYEDGTENENWSGRTITIPVIEKSEYMAEGYGYEEAMKHDGYSLTQRFWYRDQPSQESVWLSSILANGRKEYVELTYPINQRNGFNLSYKDTENSIVTNYFNINPMLSSNYVTVETYLTPEEFKDLKGGALVHFDSDLYIVSQIDGYDPSGSNPTKLKLIKKD